MKTYLDRALVLGLVPLAAALFACGPAKPQPRPLGEPCSPSQGQEAANEQCAEDLCVGLDNFSGFCSRLCNDDSDCGADFLCEASGSYGKVCKKLVGCESDGECPAGLGCNPDTGNCYIKVSRTLCSPCSDVAQCPVNGTCFNALGSGEQFCTTACAEGGGCPLGFQCKGIPAGKDGALVEQCVPVSGSCNAGKELCASCAGDSECGGPFDLCVRNVVSGETFCSKECRPTPCDKDGAEGVLGVDCTGSEDCPDDFSCLDLTVSDDPTAAKAYQCVPNSNTCFNYCDAADELGEIRQCGLGKDCDVIRKECNPSTDGRMCSPCSTNDDCSKSGGAHPENRCIVNDCPDCPFKGESFCATPCGDTPGLTGTQACVRTFGPGFLCQNVGDGSGAGRQFCMPQRGTCASGLGRVGDDCTLNGAGDCVAGVCLATGTQKICSVQCGQDADCGDSRYLCCEFTANGYDCDPGKRTGNGPTSGAGVCAPLGGLFGDDCSPGRPPCQTGTCLDLGTARLCTVPCAAGCPDGFSCRVAQPPSGDPLEVCFPAGGGGSGADCTFGPAACESGLCIRKETGNICTQGCATDDECPEDWACIVDITTVTDERITACVPPALQ